MITKMTENVSITSDVSVPEVDTTEILLLEDEIFFEVLKLFCNKTKSPKSRERGELKSKR